MPEAWTSEAPARHSSKWDSPDTASKIEVALERADLQNDTAWLDTHWHANKENCRMHVQSTCFLWKNLQKWLRASGSDPQLLKTLDERPQESDSESGEE